MRNYDEHDPIKDAARAVRKEIDVPALREIAHATAAKHKDKIEALLLNGDALFDEHAIRRDLTSLLSRQRHDMILQMLGIDARYGDDVSIKRDSPLYNAFEEAARDIVTPMINEELAAYKDPTTTKGAKLRKAIQHVMKRELDNRIDNLMYSMREEARDVLKHVALDARKELGDILTGELGKALSETLMLAPEQTKQEEA